LSVIGVGNPIKRGHNLCGVMVEPEPLVVREGVIHKIKFVTRLEGCGIYLILDHLPAPVVQPEALPSVDGQLVDQSVFEVPDWVQ